MVTSQNLKEGDNFGDYMRISGIDCFVNANYENGQIMIQVVTAISSQKYPYELRPLPKGSSEISDEVKRLFFVVKANP